MGFSSESRRSYHRLCRKCRSWASASAPVKKISYDCDYAEQEAETGCERESHMRIFLACLMCFLIGISRHVCGTAKLLPGLAAHVIRKIAYVFGDLLCGVSCIASFALAAFFKVSVVVVISLPFALKTTTLMKLDCSPHSTRNRQQRSKKKPRRGWGAAPGLGMESAVYGGPALLQSTTLA